MTFDLTKILESKRDFRRRLATRPIEEKLAMLDALRARTLALHGARPATETGRLRDESAAYSAKPKNPR